MTHHTGVHKSSGSIAIFMTEICCNQTLSLPPEFTAIKLEAEAIPFAGLHLVGAEDDGGFASADEDGGSVDAAHAEAGAGFGEVGGFGELEVGDEFAVGDFGFAPERVSFLAVGGVEFERKSHSCNLVAVT